MEAVSEQPEIDSIGLDGIVSGGRMVLFRLLPSEPMPGTGLPRMPVPSEAEWREDLVSFRESAPWFVRLDERSEPITCECCGTTVAATPEAPAADGPDRRWKRGIWETGVWRKHTLRRCDWLRGNG
jgi:hypothetical protein